MIVATPDRLSPSTNLRQPAFHFSATVFIISDTRHWRTSASAIFTSESMQRREKRMLWDACPPAPGSAWGLPPVRHYGLLANRHAATIS
jgi:hypothetical protein